MFAERMKSSAKWLLISLTFSVSACATSGPVTDSCSWVKPILVSREDVLTDGTVVQILTHNEKWELICEGAR